jgi:hypothetical protein
MRVASEDLGRWHKSRRLCEIHNLPLLFAQFGCTLPVRFFIALKEG